MQECRVYSKARQTRRFDPSNYMKALFDGTCVRLTIENPFCKRSCTLGGAIYQLNCYLLAQTRKLV